MVRQLPAGICFSELNMEELCIDVVFKLDSMDEYLHLRKNPILKETYIYAQKVLVTPVMFAGSQFNDKYLQPKFAKAKVHILSCNTYKRNVDECDIRLIFMQRQISKARPSFTF